MSHVALLIPLLPLVGFLSMLGFGSSLKEPSYGWIATSAVAGSFVATVIAFFLLLGDSSREISVNLFTWISTGGLDVHAALLVDPLSITMCLFVTGISALIHQNTIRYMHGEPDYNKFIIY